MLVLGRRLINVLASFALAVLASPASFFAQPELVQLWLHERFHVLLLLLRQLTRVERNLFEPVPGLIVQEAIGHRGGHDLAGHVLGQRLLYGVVAGRTLALLEQLTSGHILPKVLRARIHALLYHCNHFFLQVEWPVRGVSRRHVSPDLYRVWIVVACVVCRVLGGGRIADHVEHALLNRQFVLE